MQEFHQSIPGLAGRLFGGAGPTPDLRRVQAQQQQVPGARCGGVSPEAVKCPRCDSTNTKFCYYNNYNLSQPRHFCKNCRRYWTKGGVLRNVPVGGGCRKAKRSSSSSAASSSPSTPPSSAETKNPRRASASSPRSSSGSTIVSPTSAAVVTTTATPSSSSNNIAVTGGHSTNLFSTVDVTPPAPIFADQAAALASIFAASASPPLPPLVPVFTPTTQPRDDEGVVALVLPAGDTGASTSADMAPFAPLDAGIFDQLGDASAAAYWNAGSCWTDVHDSSMYLP